ncbi:hypothetical protein AOZ07_17725 [Glutamicibacter halophytocola]|uniref:DUF4258 domain-containing protein n=1 Tax=Glutamicibacter halophytocola TaxID=1933880 RepID=UPI0006D4AC67|nr:DUF4258 domain-containing protein [Glutamicibacter halophytocola]ALG30634.1 hypothetical protein AOZ07_17725 [Glutamicibacter halophytocola]
MELKISSHALSRIQQRGISEQQVNEVFTEHRRLMSYESKDAAGRWVYMVEIGERKLMVVTFPAIEDAAPNATITVITAYWH